MFEKKKYIKKGTVTVCGSSIPYEGITENFPICDAAGNADASMFTFSYIRSDITEAAGRPVLFAWNGGPGCGSLFVHMGLLSPMRVKCGKGTDLPQTAPFELVNNDNCLLDTCDVVAIDAIGTGYSRLLNPDAKSTYCSTEKDAETFIRVMRAWMTAHDRWNSPIYIMGESYGTIRNALVAEGMFYTPVADTAGGPLHVSGVIMLGSALDYGQEGFPIPRDVLNLPSIAAANWYWHPDGKGRLADYVQECEEFCYAAYLPALAQGHRLGEAEKRQIAEKISAYTGYSVEKLLEDDLKVDIMRYPARGMAHEGRSIGIYDSRFALEKVKDPETYDYFSDDASNAFSMPVFTVGFNGLWKKELGIDIEEEYVEIWNGAEHGWNFKTQRSPMRSLENAMHRNPNMKLMFGMGYFDMLTTIGWVHYFVNHYDLPADKVFKSYYESGHMPYLSDSATMKLEEDIKNFIRA